MTGARVIGHYVDRVVFKTHPPLDERIEALKRNL